MALATTTLSVACAQMDKRISIASATSVAAGRCMLVNGERMQVTKDYVSGSLTPEVLRGLEGTEQRAHAITSTVVHGLPEDFAGPAAGSVVTYPAAGPSVVKVSYGAAGAIALPTPGSNMFAVINGTSALAMTVAVPTAEMNFCELTVIANGKGAHTLTFATALGDAGSGYTVLTLPAGGRTAHRFVAMDSIWYAYAGPPWSGTCTNIVGALA